MAFHADRMSLPIRRRRADRRAALFRESRADGRALRARPRLGAERPSASAACRTCAQLCFDEFLAPDYALPDPERALTIAAGPCRHRARSVACRRCSPPIDAGFIRSRMSPPLKWWSPPTRSVLFFNETPHRQAACAGKMRQGRYTVTFDRDFEGVIAGLRRPPRGRWHLTWITPQIMRAYAELFDAGHAHSLRGLERARRTRRRRLWRRDRRRFVTVNRSSRASANTSKIGLSVLNWHLARWGYRLQRRQADDADLPRHGFPRNCAQRLPRAARARRACSRESRAAGRSRPTWRRSRPGTLRTLTTI